MKVITIEEYRGHTIKLFLFVDKSGITITSFFQAVRSPNRSLGGFATIEQARQKISQLTSQGL